MNIVNEIKRAILLSSRFLNVMTHLRHMYELNPCKTLNIGILQLLLLPQIQMKYPSR